MILETKTPFCKLCFKPLKEPSFADLFLQKPLICHQCQKKFIPIFHHFYIKGIQGLAIYRYDDTIRQYLYQLKAAYDIEIAPVFLQPYARYLYFRYRNYVLVPAPSTKTSDDARGFNQIIEIFSELKLPIIPVCVKTTDIKQAGLNYDQRQKIIQHLAIINPEKITNKNILIVDDVMTTGATIRAMIELLKTHNVKNIAVLVLAETKVSSNKTINITD